MITVQTSNGGVARYHEGDWEFDGVPDIERQTIEINTPNSLHPSQGFLEGFVANTLASIGFEVTLTPTTKPKGVAY